MMILKALSVLTAISVAVAAGSGNHIKRGDPNQADGWHNPGYVSSTAAAAQAVATVTETVLVTTICSTTITATPPECMTATGPVVETMLTTSSETASVPPPMQTSEATPSPSTSVPSVQTAAASGVALSSVSAIVAVAAAGIVNLFM